MSLPWFRMYTEFATDPDVQCLAFEDQRHYVMLLCLKGSGVLDKEYPSDQHRDKVIRRTLGLDSLAFDEAHRRLSESGLVDDQWQPLGWDKRQYKSDQSTGRVRKFREKRRGNVSVTPPDTDTDTEAEKTKSASRTRAHLLPDDFDLTSERRAVAEAEKVPADRTFATFCDYWRAASGQNARKRDWDATWRNWCRREADNGTSRRGRSSSSRHGEQPERLREWAESGGA